MGLKYSQPVKGIDINHKRGGHREVRGNPDSSQKGDREKRELPSPAELPRSLLTGFYPQLIRRGNISLAMKVG